MEFQADNTMISDFPLTGNMEDWKNATTVTEFVLVGLSTHPPVRAVLFVLFLVMYAVTVAGNGLIVVLIVVDAHLHTPMYFFLSNLSFIDVCYVTTSVPQMLAHCFTDRPTIPFGRCFAQMSIALFLAVAECLLLAVMAYDRFVAICSPLRYSLIMSRKVCIGLAASLWFSAFLLTIVPFFSMQARLCGRNVVNHFKCELQAVLKLACSDTHASGVSMLITTVFTLLFPFAFILVTYGRIGLAILRIRAGQGRGKAFSTCGSHLVVVGIFYGTALAMYLRPQTKTFTDREKVVAVFYGVVTPMMNPVIYSLRNRDVKGALRRLMGKKVEE
ncbi:olfactory receptor 13H1-like [Eublepharis macularius]|uniref:Olfactory receptor n=1 Tax=Eublepharis macularius TaxID=481883 RepID=A0AA97KMA9_EUBMA|nr:olfactory receptor 13H1-like [Eublepharis macularius]